MNFLEKLRGSLFSKLSNTGLALVLIGLAEQQAPGLIKAFVSPDYAGLALSALGAFIWFLRWVTDKPLNEK